MVNKPNPKGEKGSSLNALLALNEKTGFSDRGEAKAETAIKKVSTPNPEILTPSTPDVDVEAYPWLKEGLDQEKAMLMLNLPSDLKLFLQRLSRLIGDKESMTSVLLMCAEKELPQLARKYNLPLPKSLTNH